MSSSWKREQLNAPLSPGHPGHTEDATTPDDLEATRRDFPAFHIWRETTGDRTVYVARRRGPGTRPHTLVTHDPHELRAVLADTGQPPLPAPSSVQPDQTACEAKP